MKSAWPPVGGRLSSLVQREQKVWDKILMVAVLLLWSGWLKVMALDAARHRSSHVPVWAQGVGALGILALRGAGREDSEGARAEGRHHRSLPICAPPVYTGAILF